MMAAAGKHGRVVAKDAHFEFGDMPGVPQRFYGVNLTKVYMSEEGADTLCARLARQGYDAIRIHHHERELCDPKDGTTILPARMAQLDNLLNACIRDGIYITTDLYVSRPVKLKWRSVGVDRDGLVSMGAYKYLVLFDDKAFENYIDFSRAFLGHVNPKTGRRWADEPALACIALVNGGNPGNGGHGFIESNPKLHGKWKTWLAQRRAEAPEQYGDITEEIPANARASSRQNCAICLFLADLEIDFAERMRKFLRDEMGSKVPISDLSSWKNPIAYQLTRARHDYVDHHFYVDHPKFLEEKPNGAWEPPSKLVQDNENPVRSMAPGFRMPLGFVHVANQRLLDRPFTLSEFNYCAPGQYRGIGALLLGAQAALQGYDGIWRYSWSKTADGNFEPQQLRYFDIATDPLQRVTDRAAMTLYLRRDMKPLKHTFAVGLDENVLRTDFSCGPEAWIRDLWFGWCSRLGTVVGNAPVPGEKVERRDFPPAYSMGKRDVESLAKGLEPGDGQIRIDREEGFFAVDTPRTQGFFAENGRHATGSLSATVLGAPAAIWLSSLDESGIADAKRLLFTHITDVQDGGTRYADGAKTVLLEWGNLPHLMRAGRTHVEIRLAPGTEPKVYALRADSTRRGRIAAKWLDGTLSFTADTARDPSDATYCYGIDRR